MIYSDIEENMKYVFDKYFEIFNKHSLKKRGHYSRRTLSIRTDGDLTVYINVGSYSQTYGFQDIDERFEIFCGQEFTKKKADSMFNDILSVLKNNNYRYEKYER